MKWEAFAYLAIKLGSYQIIISKNINIRSDLDELEEKLFMKK